MKTSNRHHVDLKKKKSKRCKTYRAFKRFFLENSYGKKYTWCTPHNHTQTSWILSFIQNFVYSDVCKLGTYWTLIDDGYFHIFLAEVNWKILVYVLNCKNNIWLIESGELTLGFLQKIWKNHWFWYIFILECQLNFFYFNDFVL